MSETVRYIGDPFLDAGVAVLEHWLEKTCNEFTVTDLKRAANRLKQEYAKKIWKGYLTVHLPNSVWCNPNPKIADEKKQDAFNEVLAGFERPPLSPPRPCCYCGREGRIIADRSQIPLVTSKTSMSVGPGGMPGTPVCGYCLYAIQFYPLCTLKVNPHGKPLFWAAPEPRWTFLLAGRFLNAVEQVTSASSDKFATLNWPSTLLLNAAAEVVENWSLEPAENRPALSDIFGCHATNFGTQADYEELRIPKALLEFWAEAGTFGPLYGQIVHRAWEDAARKVRGKQTKAASAVWNRRNLLYEALGEAFRESEFEVPAKRIAVKFFLRPWRASPPQRLFDLTSYFLEKVARMERARLEAIRGIADRIAENVKEQRIERDLFAYNMGLNQLLNYFARLQKTLAEAGAPLGWDEVLLALGISNVEDRTSRDHWLVQDLILIRVYERLGRTTAEAELPVLEPLEKDAAVEGPMG